MLETVWKEVERKSKLREARYLQSVSAAIAEGVKEEGYLRYLRISMRNLLAEDKDLLKERRP